MRLRTGGASGSDQVEAEPAAMGVGPVLPEVHRLPGAQGQPAPLHAQAEAGAGEGGADVGRHVVGPLVVVDVGPQGAGAADRPHPLLGHQGPQIGRQILQHARVGVFVDGERAGGVLTHHGGQPEGDAAGGDLAVEGAGEVGEALAAGGERQPAQVLAQHRWWRAGLPSVRRLVPGTKPF